MLPGETRSVVCGVLSIADTRTPESDFSGKSIRDRLQGDGHTVCHYRILSDDPDEIRNELIRLSEKGEAQAVICSGGTGITPEDQTFEAIEGLLEKRLDGFGEIFRYLAYEEIGPAAILMRATAGVFRGMVIVSLPGSPACVKLAMEKLIMPQIGQMASLVRKRRRPMRPGVH